MLHLPSSVFRSAMEAQPESAVVPPAGGETTLPSALAQHDAAGDAEAERLAREAAEAAERAHAEAVEAERRATESAGREAEERLAKREAEPKPKAKPKAKGKPPAKPAPVEYPRPGPGVYSARDVEFELMRVQFDTMGQMGQARPLSSEGVQKRLGEIRHNPPTEPAVVELWESATGGPFVCLAGQHTCSALQMLHREVEGRGEIPRWLKIVRANVLPPGTPLEVRKLVAGAAQAREQAVVPVTVSRCCEHLLDVMAENPDLNMVDAAIVMIARAGCERPADRVCTVSPV